MYCSCSLFSVFVLLLYFLFTAVLLNRTSTSALVKKSSHGNLCDFTRPHTCSAVKMQQASYQVLTSLVIVNCWMLYLLITNVTGDNMLLLQAQINEIIHQFSLNSPSENHVILIWTTVTARHCGDPGVRVRVRVKIGLGLGLL